MQISRLRPTRTPATEATVPGRGRLRGVDVAQPTVTGTCVHCGTTFEKRARSGRELKFCSRQCAGSIHRKSDKERTSHVSMECEQCGKQFSYRATAQIVPRRYCSRACFGKGYSADAIARNTVEVRALCPYCQQEFTHLAKSPRTFCSRQCRARGVAVVPAGQDPARWRKPKNPKLCDSCSQPYMPTSARQRWCETCVPDKAAAARARRYGITAQQLSALLATHDGMCWICRQQGAQAIDHCHETGRVRGVLCRSCNMALHYVEQAGWWDAATAYLKGGDQSAE